MATPSFEPARASHSLKHLLGPLFSLHINSLKFLDKCLFNFLCLGFVVFFFVGGKVSIKMPSSVSARAVTRWCLTVFWNCRGGTSPCGVNIRAGKTGDHNSNEFSAAFLKPGLPLECWLNFPLHLLILKADSAVKAGVNGKAALPGPVPQR